jgi:hypothetical protein
LNSIFGIMLIAKYPESDAASLRAMTLVQFSKGVRIA